MVLCLGFPSLLQTDLRIIPQFSATQQFELRPSPAQSTALFLYLLLNSQTYNTQGSGCDCYHDSNMSVGLWGSPGLLSL